MEKIVENIRLHNIHALLVIGGFEVRGPQGSMRGQPGQEDQVAEGLSLLLAKGQSRGLSAEL